HPGWAASQASTAAGGSCVGRAMRAILPHRLTRAAGLAPRPSGEPARSPRCLHRMAQAPGSSPAAGGARYARRVALLACPFCREMFREAEREACPVCGVPLVAFEKLPPSDDALSEDGLPRQPEWEPLPAAFLGSSRGALAGLAALGLVAFFLPWVHL